MKNGFLLLVLLLTLSLAKAQRGFLFIQKNNKTVQTYTTGVSISMQHHYGYPIQGILAHIRNDSFSVLNYSIQKKITYNGFVYFDTLYNGYTFYSIHDIKSVPIKKNRSILQTAQGAAYLLAFSFTTLSIVNGIKFKQNFNTISKDVALKGGGFFVLSRLLGWLHKDQYIIGKKYKVALMEY
jgi:hypothetical protein